MTQVTQMTQVTHVRQSHCFEARKQKKGYSPK